MKNECKSIDNIFKYFNSYISLPQYKRTYMLIEKNKMKKAIKKGFKEEKLLTPLFEMQGSFEMGTLIDTKISICDLDEGIYLQSDENKINLAELHQLVINIFKRLHFNDYHITNKKKCIRLINEKERFYFDFPLYIYCKSSEEFCLLTQSREKLVTSKPKELNIWFRQNVLENGKQLKRIVKYLKYWNAYRESILTSKKREKKLFGGFHITVLVVHNFKKEVSDEAALFKTIQNTYNKLEEYNENGLNNPVDTSQNIFSVLNKNRRRLINEEFKKLYKNANNAYREFDYDRKIYYWQKAFGKEFTTTNN